MGQGSIRNADYALAALAEGYRSWRNLNLDTAIGGAYLKRLAGLEIEVFAQRLWHDDPTRRIDGSKHVIQLGINMPLLKLHYNEGRAAAKAKRG